MTKIHSKGNDCCFFLKILFNVLPYIKNTPIEQSMNDNSKNLFQRRTKTNKSFTFFLNHHLSQKQAYANRKKIKKQVN
jgi:hypothetical protein